MSVLFFDGAFGTYYRAKTDDNSACETACINNPDAVRAIHLEYLESGVGAIKTNTFGANSLSGLEQNTIDEIIKLGYEIASDAAKKFDARVFADIGVIDSDTADEEYLHIAKEFIRLGASDFLFETLNDSKPLKKAIEFIKSNTEKPYIITSFAVSQDGYTTRGRRISQLFDEAYSYGADVVGLNCVCGPYHMYNIIRDQLERGFDLTQRTLSVMPNSGYPSVVRGRTEYIDNPEYFAEKCAALYSLGVKIIGGCCGTTPQHTKMAIERIKSFAPEKTTVVYSHTPSKVNHSHHFTERARILIAAEINAPSTPDCSDTLECARTFKSAGADMVTVPDSPLARPRADSILLSCKINREAGITAMPHLTCRDRNTVAIKGSLIGATMEGIERVLIITGDPIIQVNRGESKGVFNFNSVQLISYIESLNSDILSSCPMTVCAALATSAANFSSELEKAKKKVDSGAAAFLTQPIYCENDFENILKAKEQLNCRIFAGILPLSGFKNAVFLNNEVPGINIPENVLDTLEKLDTEQQREYSLERSKGTIDRLLDAGFDSFYIMPPKKRTEMAAELISYIRRQCI